MHHCIKLFWRLAVVSTAATHSSHPLIRGDTSVSTPPWPSANSYASPTGHASPSRRSTVAPGGTTRTASARHDDENSGETGRVRVDAELDVVGDEIDRPDRTAVVDGHIQTRVTGY